MDTRHKKVDYWKLSQGLQMENPDEFDSSTPQRFTQDIKNVKELDESIKLIEHEMMVLDVEEKAVKLRLELETRRRKVHELKTELGQVMGETKAGIPMHKLTALPQSVLRSQHHGPVPNDMQSSPDVLRVDLDPQVYLNLNKPASGKYRAIVDFIPRSANCEEEEVELATGIFIKLKSGLNLS